MIIETKLTPIKMIFNKGDFRIYSCTTKDHAIQLNKYSNASIKGVMQRLDLGVEYVANVELTEVHPQYGASYECHSIYQDMPSSGEDQKSFFRYLLTDKQVEELFKVYLNEDIIQMIVDDKFNSKLVKGIGEKTYKQIRKKVLENIEHRDLLSKLGRYGITYNVVMKIAEKFESVQLAIQKIEDNPYCLCELVSGIGFKKADIIARKMGFVFDHPFRIQSGIKYTLENNQQEGHTYMIIDKMVKAAIDNLDINENLINEQIKNTEGIIVIGDKIALLKTYQAEKHIATKLKQMLHNSMELNFDPNEFIHRMEVKYKDTLKHGLSEQQKEFFHNVKKHSASLLVGYAGTGKTQMQRLLVELLEELGMSYVLLSPTGKAAKLLSSYTGRQAQTIHRAIGYGKDKEQRQLI
jgi:ATP-dependent exoDNAse (exonuclease V) alpha subunit